MNDPRELHDYPPTAPRIPPAFPQMHPQFSPNDVCLRPTTLAPMGLADAPLDRTQLDSLCRLARLQLSGAERERLGHRLRAVVQAFASLAAVDTAGVPPYSAPEAPDHPAGRDDVPGPVLSPETALANSQETAAGCFLVPRVVEG